MPIHNNEDSGDRGRRRNPWGASGPQGGESGSGGGWTPRPKNPWGEPPRPRDEGQKGSGAPDFDEFIRRSQERLRGLGGGPRGSDGSGRSGPPRVQVPWKWIVGGVLALWIVGTSTYQVGAGERGVVTRFAKFHTTSGPGFHLKLPTPIDRVTKVRFEDIRTTDIGSTDASVENLMITGDQNIIDIAYTVRWRLKNAEQFLFQIANPELTVRDVTEAAMREMMSKTTLQNAIGPERASIAEEVRERTQEILDLYGSGILVQGVDIRQADPPAAVDEAFKDVSAAQQDAQQFLNQARAYAQQVRARAQGETAAFDKIYEEYRLAPQVTRQRMYYETMEQVLSKVDKTIIENPGVQAYLPLPEVQRRARQADLAAIAARREAEQAQNQGARP
jgi:membrane protease subunit HflK